jgi:hypothetical protein
MKNIRPCIGEALTDYEEKMWREDLFEKYADRLAQDDRDVSQQLWSQNLDVGNSVLAYYIKHDMMEACRGVVDDGILRDSGCYLGLWMPGHFIYACAQARSAKMIKYWRCHAVESYSEGPMEPRVKTPDVVMLIQRNDHLSAEEKDDALYFIRKWACVPYTGMHNDFPNSCVPKKEFETESDDYEAWYCDLYPSCAEVFKREMWQDANKE